MAAKEIPPVEYLSFKHKDWRLISENYKSGGGGGPDTHLQSQTTEGRDKKMLRDPQPPS